MQLRQLSEHDKHFMPTSTCALIQDIQSVLSDVLLQPSHGEAHLSHIRELEFIPYPVTHN